MYYKPTKVLLWSCAVGPYTFLRLKITVLMNNRTTIQCGCDIGKFDMTNLLYPISAHIIIKYWNIYFHAVEAENKSKTI